MSPPNIAKYCVIPACPCSRARTAAACDNVKLFLFKSYVSLCFVQRHFDASTCHEGLLFASHISLAAISDFTKSNLVCRVVMKATNIRLTDDRNNGRFWASKLARKRRPFCRRQDEAQGENCHTDSLWLGLGMSKAQELIQRILQR